MKDTMEEAIVLLNDGEVSNEEGNCNSWPNPRLYLPDWMDCQPTV